MVMGAGGTSVPIAEILILGWYRSWQNVPTVKEGSICSTSSPALGGVSFLDFPS